MVTVIACCVTVGHVVDGSRCPILDEMATQPEPQPLSARGLTLQAVSTTARRALASQRGLRAAGSDTAGAPDTDTDDRRADDVDPPLPHPIITDALLRHHLEQAMAHQDGPRPQRRPLRLLGHLQRFWGQATFNAAAVNALHQLDHRTRLQQDTIAELEAATRAQRRTLAILEAQIAALTSGRDDGDNDNSGPS